MNLVCLNFFCFELMNPSVTIYIYPVDLFLRILHSVMVLFFALLIIIFFWKNLFIVHLHHHLYLISYPCMMYYCLIVLCPFCVAVDYEWI